MYHMKTASIRDLRYDFPKIERALRAGQEIQITKRNRVIARLVPENPTPERPDFAARIREIYGDTRLEVSGGELISRERDER
jgi:antitoxin (DNA-binding transcriptional repressor) of toxin-antitoxin stability system